MVTETMPAVEQPPLLRHQTFNKVKTPLFNSRRGLRLTFKGRNPLRQLINWALSSGDAGYCGASLAAAARAMQRLDSKGLDMGRTCVEAS